MESFTETYRCAGLLGARGRFRALGHFAFFGLRLLSAPYGRGRLAEKMRLMHALRNSRRGALRRFACSFAQLAPSCAPLGRSSPPFDMGAPKGGGSCCACFFARLRGAGGAPPFCPLPPPRARRLWSVARTSLRSRAVFSSLAWFFLIAISFD